jgi:N-methylhydantoinase A
MLSADVIKHYTQTVMLPGDTLLAEINQLFEPILEQGRRDLLDEGIDLIDIELKSSLDIRYRGQSYELSVPFDDNFIALFHQNHQDTYGYSQLDAPTEIVNVRIQAIGRVPTPPIPSSPMSGPNPEESIIDRRSVTYPAGREEVSFYRGESLKPGNQFIGPAVVVRADTTILINQTNHVTVDRMKNLLISIE